MELRYIYDFLMMRQNRPIIPDNGDCLDVNEILFSALQTACKIFPRGTATNAHDSIYFSKCNSPS